ncbi:hypothetical protein DL546_004100 [Coniochaeta pulveracea]|uniref:DUF952 domain-containing protein n=1 Tax=Coniochaeta pulveracea TaxID=177199 RepID=A0A420YFV7_9PEZI|nr:hypothetical protein DL546_004100 [Coniochaeta pulveracea]
MPAPHPLPRYVYKILPSAPPSPIPEPYPLSDLDKKDGFIHLSTSSQVPKTADLFFTHSNSIWLFKIPLAKFSQEKVKWEDAGESTFPHLYGNFGGSDVEDVSEFKRQDGMTWGQVFQESGWLV